MLRIDHVVRAVRDLDEAGERWDRTLGLSSIPGGVHPRWGTANRIVPLGRDYLELMAIVDRSAAAATVLGRALLALTADGDAWFAVCVADDDIDATAARLDMEVVPGSRERPDGSVVSWRGAGIEDPRRTADLPFFIAWDGPPGQHPGAASAAHRSGATGIAWVEIVGDAERCAAWTGAAALPVRFVGPGPPVGIRRIGLASPGEEIVV